MLARSPRLTFPPCPPAVIAFMRTHCHTLFDRVTPLLPELQAFDKLVVHLAAALIADIVLGAHFASLWTDALPKLAGASFTSFRG